MVEVPRGAPRPVDAARRARSAPHAPEMPARAPAPVRSIPVVVAPAGKRPAVRRRAGSGEADPVARVDTAPQPVLPGPGAQLCPSCGTSVAADRRFCRCGARLPSASQASSEPRIDAVAMRRSTFRRAQRLANHGRRPRYDVPLSWRTRFARAFVVLLVLGAVGSQVPPWGDDVRSWLDTRVQEAVPWQ
ncbi:zinc ribbon domain-containing protein [Geodermatophilus ruber]|uniref:zinc ribbon domain-containing protein n=1 Tax=Geodermatophilus ruber TaxID=504800 RepID=UPI0011607E00|nr:zinc ribbon domain-containing protein [Geodermatophilus ruber]